MWTVEQSTHFSVRGDVYENDAVATHKQHFRLALHNLHTLNHSHCLYAYGFFSRVLVHIHQR
jgi:hypothetical protein